MKDKIYIYVFLILSINVNAGTDTGWSDYDVKNVNEVKLETLNNVEKIIKDEDDDLDCHDPKHDVLDEDDYEFASTIWDRIDKCPLKKDEEEYKGVINTLDITSKTLEALPNCLDWKLKGICVWLKCKLFYCTIVTNLKVEHFIPELVVQAYDRANGEPWSESQQINRIAQADADSSFVKKLIELVEEFPVNKIGIRGGISTEGKKNQHSNLGFKLVDAYGNPVATTFYALAQLDFSFMCKGKAFPLVPYYVSNLDAISWRWNIPEMLYPQSILPGINKWDLGSLTNNYGPIYPRHGFHTTQDDIKSSVLSAFRAVHFITRDAQPHLYIPIYAKNKKGYWPANPLDQGDKKTGVFQMLYPMSENSCHQFPYSSNPSQERRSSDGSYVWSYWKSYKCCKKSGQTLLFHSG